MPTETLRVVLGDQLSRSIAALSDLDPARDVVLMAEVIGECAVAPYHRKKLVLVLSAMRHFARALTARGVRVRYVRLDDPENIQTLAGEVRRAVADLEPGHVVVTEPGAWRVLDSMRGWVDGIEIRSDTRFVCSIADFRHWVAGRTGLRMEFFYRQMRRHTGLLMTEDAQPEGGRWNFDAENRRRLPASLQSPPPPEFAPDEVTRQVIELVQWRFPDGFGALDGFHFPVTAVDAEAALADFIAHRLPGFGDWQDAMRRAAPSLFHAVISPALNIGLLDPLAVCQAVEAAWRSGRVALNAAEGFIRQIIGWREYMRGIYWLRMPEYATLNALAATRPLPDFYWSGETRMECIRQVVMQTRRDAYAHHIQRLMVTGNFALLAGLHPDAVDEWYLAVYADAYQWVEMPNTRGMALFADGGIVGSKPYAASGAYINRMSDYCGACSYDVKQTTGAAACPFNALYWDFIARHADRLEANPRMAMPVRSWTKMAADRRTAIRAQAADFLAGLDDGAGNRATVPGSRE
ncbi:cryptochrome/photolyase family protein [Rhodopila sp.]|uniref:cryptochrome/photolyase family protein n=1 Tax=Rhodopila sp. TaxID=2480087 RepID=UPI003D13B1A1